MAIWGAAAVRLGAARPWERALLASMGVTNRAA